MTTEYHQFKAEHIAPPLSSSDCVSIYQEMIGAQRMGVELTGCHQELFDTLAKRLTHEANILGITVSEIPQPTAIAPGHNPDNLTVEQVGDGWRLLDRDEVQRKNARILKEIEKWDGKRWEDTGWFGDGGAETYRTRLTREQLAAKRRGE